MTDRAEGPNLEETEGKMIITKKSPSQNWEEKKQYPQMCFKYKEQGED